MTRPARRPTGRAVTLALAVMLLAALATALWIAIGTFPPVPLHVTIDGEEVFHGVQLAELATGQRLVLVIGLVLALLTALVAIPVALMIALLGVLLAVASVIGLPLLIAAMVVALLLSPVLLVVWLVWRALRPRPTITA